MALAVPSSQGRSSAVAFFYACLLQAIDDAMSSALCPLVVGYFKLLNTSDIPRRVIIENDLRDLLISLSQGRGGWGIDFLQGLRIVTSNNIM